MPPCPVYNTVDVITILLITHVLVWITVYATFITATVTYDVRLVTLPPRLPMPVAHTARYHSPYPTLYPFVRCALRLPAVTALCGREHYLRVPGLVYAPHAHRITWDSMPTLIYTRYVITGYAFTDVVLTFRC